MNPEHSHSVLPQRSRTYGVGKQIGGCVYLHARYEARLGEQLDDAKRRLPADFDYTVVKLNERTGALSFIQSANFDTTAEPTVGRAMVVRDGEVRCVNPPDDPYIYHHKWLFVDDDYDGFDVADSKARSLQWTSLDGIDYRRIGRLSYWNRVIVPQLQAACSQ